MTAGNVPADLVYTKSHEWVRRDGDELVLGITDHAQSELTDIVFVDLPKVDRAVAAGESLLVLESVKTVADVYAPAPGTISAVNEDLKKHPENVNREPYGAGWLVRLRPTAPFEPSQLLTAEQYTALVESGAGSP